MSGTGLSLAYAALSRVTVADPPEHAAIDEGMNRAGETAERAMQSATAALVVGVAPSSMSPLTGVVMHNFFAGHLLSADDLGAEQQANHNHGAGSAAAGSSDHQPRTPAESLPRSLPASPLDAVALNPQPLPPKARSPIKTFEGLASIDVAIQGLLNQIEGLKKKEHLAQEGTRNREVANSGTDATLRKSAQAFADMMEALRFPW